MKKFLFIVGLLFSGASQAATISINFDDPASLNLFSSVNGFSRSTPLDPEYLANGGIGGTGAIGDSYTVSTYAEQSFDFSQTGSEITVSALALLPSDITSLSGYIKSFANFYLVQEVDQHGYIDDSLFGMFGQTHYHVELFGGALQAGGGGFPGYSEDLPLGLLNSNNWFEFSVIFANLGNSIGYTLGIDDYGSTGTSLVSSFTSNQFITVDPHGFTQDDSVFAGFEINTSTVAWDNFSITINQPVNDSISVSAPGRFVLLMLFLSFLIGLRSR